jgi:hypothetical protein
MRITPPFKLWVRLCALGPLLVLLILSRFVFPDSAIAEVVFSAAIFLLIPLCAVGAVMGILLAFNRLFFRCPFCSASARCVAGNNKRLWIDCPTCRLISGTYSRFPPLTYRIERETDQDRA